jgi:hypothetical protein
MMTVQASNIVSVPADYFVARMTESVKDGEYHFCGSDMDVAAIEVTGSVDLTNVTGTEFAKAFSIENVHFRDALRIDNCKFGNTVSLKSCTFDRSINLGKTVFRNGLSFTDCRFGVSDTNLDSAVIILDDANIRGDVLFDRVSVHGCILARRLRLIGDMQFTACTVDGRSSDAIAAPLDLSNGRIRGSVVFETGQASPAIEPSLAEILNEVAAARKPRLQRSFFRDRRKGGTCVLMRGAEVTELVRLGWARFAGELDLAFIKCRVLISEAGFFARRPDEPAPGNISQKTIAPNEGFGGAKIEGPVTLSGGEFGLIHLYGVSICGEVMLVAGRSGQINIEDSICEGVENERFVATSRLGNFIMSRWRCRDFLYLHAAEITGKTNASRVRGFVIISSVIDRGVSLWPGLTLQKTLQGYLEPEADEKRRPKFIGIRPDGSLAHMDSDPILRNLLNRWRRRLVIRGNISIDHCSIGDDVQLTGVDLIAASMPTDGRIEIVDTKIDGNLIFQSPISFIADAHIEQPLLRLLAERFVVAVGANGPQQGQVQPGRNFDHNAPGQDVPFAPAFCHALNTGALVADKIDLTGLCVLGPFDPSAAKSTDAVLDYPAESSGINLPNAVMTNLKVNGKVATFARISREAAEEIFVKIDKLVSVGTREEVQKPKFELRPRLVDWERELLIVCFGEQVASIRKPDRHLAASAKISGSLDFRHSQIEELLISDDSFREHSPESKAVVSGVVLDHAQISKLYVARSDLEEITAGHHNGFPVPVSLLDVSVKTWFLEDEGAPDSLNTAYIDEETATADPYLDLLDNDPELRMSSYLAIEKSLRDRGLSDEARQIFIAGNYRDVRTESGKNQPAKESAGAYLARSHSRLKWKIWRRGDGRNRGSMFAEFLRAQDGKRDPLVVGLCAIGVVATVFAIAGIIIKHSPVSFAWLAIVVFYLFALHGKVFRLQRPLHEYVGFFFCVIWCGGTMYTVYAVVVFLTDASSIGYLSIGLIVIGLIFLLVIGFALWSAMRCSLDQLYWSLVDYGTSAIRLAGVIVFLIAVSFVFVSGNRQNFEPTLLAELHAHTAKFYKDRSEIDGLKDHYALLADRADQPAAPSIGEDLAQSPKWDESKVPAEESWTFGERLWMTLRFHVPLVGAVISEEWQPAHRPLSFAGWIDALDQREVPAWWPRARDWYAAMLWTNWILWPLFLPFLIHTLSRER